LELLAELKTHSNAAILLATHDANVAAQAARTIHMRDGRIVDSLP